MSGIRRYYDNIPYFITSITKSRFPLFKNQAAVYLLIRVITLNKIPLQYKVYGFIIMPDHFHIIIHPFGNHNISNIMKNIKANFSRSYNIQINTQGSIWQKGFYDEGVRSEQMLNNFLAYIHNNPIKHDIAENINEYAYSSYGYYFYNDTTFDDLLDKPE